jgi:hypothetical protein
MSELKDAEEPEKERKKKNGIYRMKGVPLNTYIDETGEFKSVPDPSACANKEGAKTILDVFNKCLRIDVMSGDHASTAKKHSQDVL